MAVTDEIPEERVTEYPEEIGRVVMISGSFPPMPCGVGDSAHELACALAAAGVQVEILTDIGAHAADQDTCPIAVHPEIGSWGLGRIKKLVRSVESLSPDILHIHYPTKAYGRGLAIPFLPMLIRARRRRFRIVTTLHEFRLSHPFRKLATFLLIDPSDAIVMPCPLELAALKRRHVSVEEKIHAAIPVGPVGPSPDGFDEARRAELRNRIRQGWRVGDDQVVLLHYGIPTPSKGIEVIFKALRLLGLEGETPILMIVGDFSPKANDFHRLLYGQPGGLGVRDQVRWLGRCLSEELPGIFLASDIGVFPFLDGFSLRRSSLVGVLNWGLPIVTTEPDGDLPEVEGQQKVRFVARNDAKALATALLPLVANPRSLEVAKSADNRLMDLFRWDRIAGQYVDIYRQVMKKR